MEGLKISPDQLIGTLYVRTPTQKITIREKVTSCATAALACLAAPFKSCFSYLVHSKTAIVNLTSCSISKIAHAIKKCFGCRASYAQMVMNTSKNSIQEI